VILAFSSHVGTGSDEHCLSGSACTSLMTSVGVTGRKNRSSQPTGAAVNCEAGAPAVASAPATLSWKKRWSCDASISATVGAWPRPSSWSKDYQSRRGWCRSESTRVVQYSDRLRHVRSKYRRRSVRHAITCEFLLAFRSNYGPILYRFWELKIE